MPTPLYSLTGGGIGVRLAYAMGDRLEDGTADSGSTSTIVHDQWVDADDSRLKGRWIWVHTGVGVGEIRRVLSFTAGTDTIVPTPNFAATIGSTSQYLITEQWSPHQYIEAIRRAQRHISRISFKEQIDRSIITGSPLNNGTFYNWTSGTSSAPDTWTLGGSGAAVAQETTQVRGGLYAAKITSAAAEATLSQSLGRIGRFRGASVSFKAWVWNATAGEVAIRLTDGVTTNSTDNVGSDNWEFLETDKFTVTAAATELTASFRVDTGTKIGYVAMAYIPVTMPQEYDIEGDHDLVWIDGTLELGGTIPTSNGNNADSYMDSIPPEAWNILQETPRRIQVHREQLGNRVLGVKGWETHADMTTDSIAWTGNPEHILAWARVYMMETATGRTRFSSEEIREARAEARDADKAYRTKMNAPKRVEIN